MKITKINQSKKSINPDEQNLYPSKASRSRVIRFRMIAVFLWLLAIGCEIWAIVILQKPPINMTSIIILLAVGLVTVVIGSLLWKKANRINPASSKEKWKFFIQNQLGVIISVIAFLPLFILIFKNENLDKKQKQILASVAGGALVIAGLTSADFDPPSQEKYLKQSQEVKDLNEGVDYVYWTRSGKSYHLYSECSYINTHRTHEIFEGTVAQAKELKNIVDLCDRCQSKAKKRKNQEN
ncbi:MAG: hypothetical protein VW080_08215 [Flavobacteriaceae bacterium]